MACVEYPDSRGAAGLCSVVEVVLDQGGDVVGGHQAVARPACDFRVACVGLGSSFCVLQDCVVTLINSNFRHKNRYTILYQKTILLCI